MRVFKGEGRLALIVTVVLAVLIMGGLRRNHEIFL